MVDVDRLKVGQTMWLVACGKIKRTKLVHVDPARQAIAVTSSEYRRREILGDALQQVFAKLPEAQEHLQGRNLNGWQS